MFPSRGGRRGGYFPSRGLRRHLWSHCGRHFGPRGNGVRRVAAWAHAEGSGARGGMDGDGDCRRGLAGRVDGGLRRGCLRRRSTVSCGGTGRGEGRRCMTAREHAATCGRGSAARTAAVHGVWTWRIFEHGHWCGSRTSVMGRRMESERRRSAAIVGHAVRHLGPPGGGVRRVPARAPAEASGTIHGTEARAVTAVGVRHLGPRCTVICTDSMYMTMPPHGR